MGESAAQGFTLFDTAIGRCGIAWSERGVAGTQLPEARDSETRARMRRRFPDAPEAHFAAGSGARGAFEGAGAPHYREHAAEVREWRQATTR